ncbi:MAG TPA: LPS-assembly protein LptD [Candidatus Avacidaminococcus intestinavium]|uniref:LPS-assembly protein LptD n=1 Tax=Candidatus Avacidaminococcus intestinavium TaxID=2840684 RepID=A0A9D1MND9_9FIRM|nr:LPS-assembly protein LptD [Candidatus Avacidaminococcus intestinavium]
MKKHLLIAGVLSFGIASQALAADFTAGDNLNERSVPNFEKQEPTSTFAEDVAAAAKVAPQKSESENTSEAPIVLFGDNLIYHKDTGEVTADGQVRVIRGEDVLYTTKVEGNLNTGDIYLRDGGSVVKPDSKIDSEWLYYNMNSKKGEFKKLAGHSGKDIFKAEHGISNGEIIELDQGGQLTRCPAVEHDPCFLIAAEKIEIYPQDKVVAHNVKIYMKGKLLFTRKLYVSRLNGGPSQIFAPKLGYSKEDGLKVRLHYEHYLNQRLTVVGDFDYYEKEGYRPMYGLRYDTDKYYLRAQQGWSEDSDDNWIKKKNDFTAGLKNQRLLANVPVQYSLYYNRGLWKEKRFESWHTEYGIHLQHERIYFGKAKNTFLTFGLGGKTKKESYDGSKTDTMTYNATVGRKFDDRWNAWNSYYWEKTENDLFKYNRPDMSEELQTGVSYAFDKKNRLTFINRYDLGKSDIYEQVWRYTHDFCCWQIEIEFRDKKAERDKSWHIKYDLFRW